MKTRSVEVLFSPAEYEALGRRDLAHCTCVVFDILRATSTIVTALARGAAAVIPVREIREALDWKARDPSVLLAGEREGFRITARVSGSIDFDLGNSPREFTPETVSGRTIVITTTNGTRAIQACRGATEILIASFLNLGAVAGYLETNPWSELLLVCGGTREEACYEDALAAGALSEGLGPCLAGARAADSVQIARTVYRAAKDDLLGAMQWARNGRRLLSIEALRDDVPFCLQRDCFPWIARVEPDGRITATKSAEEKLL